MIEHLLIHFDNIRACQEGKTKAESIGSAWFNDLFCFSNSDDTLKAPSLDEVEMFRLILFWLRD